MAFPMENELEPDSSKHAWEVIFSRKTKNIAHPMLLLINIIAFQAIYQ